MEGRRPTKASSSSPESSGRGCSPPLVLYSPEDSPVEEEESNETGLGSATPFFPRSSEDLGLDDLVTQLQERAQQWKDLTRELRRSREREQALRATNAEQIARIAELEEKSGVEYILSKLERTRAINKELKATIKNYKDDTRDSNWLRQRNLVLERQLTEKTAEVDTTKQLLKTLPGFSSHSKSSRDLHLSTAAPCSHSEPSRDTHLSPAPPAPSRSRSPRDPHLSASSAASSDFDQPLKPQFSAAPSASIKSRSSQDSSLPAAKPATSSPSSRSTSLRGSHVSEVSAASLSSGSSRNPLISVVIKSYSPPKPSRDPHLLSASAATSHPKSVPDAHLLVAAARRITEETTRFLAEGKMQREGAEKKLEKENQESASEKAKPDAISKRKCLDGEGVQRNAKRRNTAWFWGED
jgi:hypothetical protein